MLKSGLVMLTILSLLFPFTALISQFAVSSLPGRKCCKSFLSCNLCCLTGLGWFYKLCSVLVQHVGGCRNWSARRVTANQANELTAASTFSKEYSELWLFDIFSFFSKRRRCLVCIVIVLQRRKNGILFCLCSRRANCQSSIDCINMQLNGNSAMQRYCGKHCMNGPFNYP